ncbi:MAG TPA: cytochrome c [Steroidobacteraceae bacterium]|jgi:mono/diheme cytochrome c family protein|nr:cytochrome c [Steroidobacteraceae bacterium]
MNWKVVLAVLAVGFAGLLVMMGVARVSDSRAGERNLVWPAASPAVIARGAYLARLGDCAACHSIPGKPAYSGGLRMAIPIGAIYTTNITPDPKDGIGRMSLDDFDRALRFGVAEGHSLYPAMPFTSYYNTRPEDVAALYTYFKYGVAAAAVPNRTNDIAFPLSMRWPLSFWRWFFAPSPKPFAPSPGMDSQLAQGAYFVEGLGHCGECHTPRALAMQMKATTPAGGDAYLSGAVIENYFAPSLRNGGPGTLSTWGAEELAQFLQTGANAQGIAFGSMSDVIIHSTQYMTPADALATAKYLKALSNPGEEPATRFTYDATEHLALKNGDAGKPGAMIYLNNCAACHRPDGVGYEQVFPRLAGNPVVQAGNPQSLISIVLDGSQTPRTTRTPAQFTMPRFAWRLSDKDVADVVNFIRTSWGNKASPVSPAEVAKSRKSLQLRQASTRALEN